MSEHNEDYWAFDDQYVASLERVAKAAQRLDALVAERVMGWMVFPQPQDEGEWSDVWAALDQLENGRVGVLYPRHLGVGSGPADLEDGQMIRWSPSTDISAAFEVVEQLGQETSMSLCRNRDPYGGQRWWVCEFWDGRATGLGKRDWFAEADTAPLAICLAALKVVEA